MNSIKSNKLTMEKKHTCNECNFFVWIQTCLQIYHYLSLPISTIYTFSIILYREKLKNVLPNLFFDSKIQILYAFINLLFYFLIKICRFYFDQ